MHIALQSTAQLIQSVKTSKYTIHVAHFSNAHFMGDNNKKTHKTRQQQKKTKQR